VNFIARIWIRWLPQSRERVWPWATLLFLYLQNRQASM
jgi:hypothetical protein